MRNILKSLFTGQENTSSIQHTPLTIETIYLPCVCAVFNEPWIACYWRCSDSKFFTYASSVKGMPAGAGQHGSVAQPVTWDEQNIDPESFAEECAWCQSSDALIFCDACQQFVCSGQVQWKGWRGHKPYFRCRDSCGAAFYGTSASFTYHGSRSSQDNTPRRAANSNSNAKALPRRVNTRLLK